MRVAAFARLAHERGDDVYANDVLFVSADGTGNVDVRSAKADPTTRVKRFPTPDEFVGGE
jgi:hypothetical protein